MKMHRNRAICVNPALWKQEFVTEATKDTNPKTIKDLHKISCTSDYSKFFERFPKEWGMDDICGNLDLSQYGEQIGTGTEHMRVCHDRLVDFLFLCYFKYSVQKHKTSQKKKSRLLGSSIFPTLQMICLILGLNLSFSIFVS